MFIFHAALALNLLALCAGCALYIYGSSRCDCKGACFAKFMAVIVIILSILSAACVMSAGMKTWNEVREQCKAGVCENTSMTQNDQASSASTDKPAAAKAKPARAHR